MKRSGSKSPIFIMLWERSGYALHWKEAGRKKVELMKQKNKFVLEWEPKAGRGKALKAFQKMQEKAARKKKNGGKHHGR